MLVYPPQQYLLPLVLIKLSHETSNAMFSDYLSHCNGILLVLFRARTALRTLSHFAWFSFWGKLALGSGRFESKVQKNSCVHTYFMSFQEVSVSA